MHSTGRGSAASRPAVPVDSGGQHGSFSLEHLRQSATSHCGSRSGEPCSIVEAVVLAHPKQGRWPLATDPAWVCTWADQCTGRCIGFAHGLPPITARLPPITARLPPLLFGHARL